MFHENYFSFLMNYFSSNKGDQVAAGTLLGCMSMKMENLLSLLAVVLAVSLSDLVSGYYDVHRRLIKFQDLSRNL
jgi:hypothetical protein